MITMTLRLFILVYFLSFLFGFTQTKDVINVNKNVFKDTLIDGQSQVLKKISATTDSLSKTLLVDQKLPSEIDKRWLKELYKTSLFDTIYKSIVGMKYDSIYYPELPTDTLKKRLALLNSKTPFNIEYNTSLESVIKNYLKNRKDHIESLMALSAYYFPMFERELDKVDVPLELKYLAVIESALKPKAKSRVGAAGLWQFMFTTGKMFGLNVSSYVDERSDPIKSTEAASKYLASLFKTFGDWDLALAAYNSGPGNVSKAIRRSGGYQNYWNIRPHLPRETAGYLPAFLATMYIFEYADAHGFNPKKPKITYVQTDTIRVKEMISLNQISELLDVTMKELQFLNPSYKLDIIPFIKGENYTLRLPQEKIGVFVANEDSIYQFARRAFANREKPLPEFVDNDTKIRYKVRSGDYLGKIANQYGVGVSQIKNWNGLKNNNLRVGQRLTIFPRKLGNQLIKFNKQNQGVISKLEISKTYTVQKGDSLWSISQRFPGISIQNIKEWNNISSSKLKIGTTLVIGK